MASMDLALKDRVYVVTGASRGLGRATAEVLVAEGAKVVVSSRDRDSVDACVAALGGPESAYGIAADNADPGTPDALITAARDTFGRLDGGLISVGGPTAGPAMERTDEEWVTAFEAVFLGAVRLATALGRELGDGGSIVFVLSTSVKQPLSGLAISNGLRPGPRHGREEPRRRARTSRHPGQRPAAGPGRHRAGPRARRPGATTRRLPARPPPSRSRCAATGSPRSSDGSLPSCSPRPPAYLTGAMVPVDGGHTRAL